MVTVALTVTFLSYGVLYYGLALVDGVPVKFGTVIIPGRYSGAVPTSAGSTFTPGSDKTASTGKTARGSDTYGGGGNPGPVYNPA